MADRIFYDDQSRNLEQKTILGSVEPNGSSAPLNVKGLGFTVVRTTTGEFTVTLNDEYMQLLGAFADLALATPNGDIATVAAVNVESTGSGPQTAVIQTLASGSPADIAAATGNMVSFELVVQNTLAPPTTTAV
jgi:hypothetical protein